MTLAIGVDIGGTKIAAGLVSETGQILDSVEEPTPEDASAIPVAVADLVERLTGEQDAVGIGIGAAGFVGEDRQTVRFAPNIDWREEPLGQRVQSLVKLPVVVENDANAAAWGEFSFGAGEDTDDDLLLITVGTGIGGGIVHHGQLYRGGFGVAAEIGHMRIVPDGILCGCGQRGCYEQYGSGSALVRDARERVLNEDPRAGAIAALGGGDPSRITGQELTKLAKDGDPLAVELLTELGRWIGEGAAVLATILDPSVIAIGGGVAAAGDLVLASVVEAFETHLPARAHRPQASLRLATLGNEAGIIGAADLARVEPV
ncbi:ROK family glucokinase [Aeromicrobium wangtongii]|uniref:Glucokinase n=1 Tax=Aeromicrobium wangtongii TaxID=2969247 RepID=A0ABY5MA58_9ACTN|nr:ROK family glucokinase [Aeromicrobium wangtongii]MCD9197528.1 ROK family glucokinase [Aeromicrobium wangtongii]UUP15019.1 ROK family glucokinase [Aeromicrobium wangtongii]